MRVYVVCMYACMYVCMYVSWLIGWRVCVCVCALARACICAYLRTCIYGARDLQTRLCVDINEGHMNWIYPRARHQTLNERRKKTVHSDGGCAQKDGWAPTMKPQLRSTDN